MNTQAPTSVQFWAAIGLVAGFFMPWFMIGGIISLPGYQVSDVMRQQANKTIESDKGLADNTHYQLYRTREQKDADAKKVLDAKIQIVLSYVLYLIPVLGVLGILLELRGGRRTGGQAGYSSSSVIALASFGIMYWQEDNKSDFVQHASFGAWLTAGCAVVLLLGELWHLANPKASIAKAPTTGGGSPIADDAGLERL